MDKTVFLGGSQTITRLPEEVQARLSDWMSRQVYFAIGDCKGADQLMQQFLAAQGYEKVWVFVSGDEIRCNEGAWSVVHCHTSKPPHSYGFYRAKDEAMAETGDEALMLWDGKSIGTRENIIEVRSRGKEVRVFVMEGDDCREEYCGEESSTISDKTLQAELRRYGKREASCIAAAAAGCPRAEAELLLRRDEVFMLRRVLPNGQPDPASPLYPAFLNFSEVEERIRQEAAAEETAMPRQAYALEKWKAQGGFQIQQTVRFDMEGGAVKSFRQLRT